MWDAILRFFGIRKKRAPIRNSWKNVQPKNYYRKGGRYYSVADDSLIEDIILLDILAGYYDEGHIEEYFETPEIGDVDSVDVTPTVDIWKEEPEEDILDMDVSDTPVVSVEEATNWKVEVPAEEYVEPATYTPDPEPEPETKRESYSAGYSDSSSSYDSGSSYDSSDSSSSYD